MTSRFPAVALLATALSLPAATATAQDRVHAFVGAEILTMAGEGPQQPEQPVRFDPGILIVRDGIIRAVGAEGDVRIPNGAVVHDVSGMVIMPGLVDTHSHVGGGWGGDRSEPIQPDVRVFDSIDPRHAGFQRAQAGGITTANVMSGSGHLMSGQTLYLKHRDADTIDEMAIRDGEGRVAGGMKMANGTNSLRDPPFPGTRAKSAALVRQRFRDALAYREKKERAARKPDADPVPIDLANEALLEVLDGQRIVHHHTHRHDDILTVLRLAEEFGLRVVLHHASEGWKVASQIAAAEVPVSLIVVDSPGGKLEARDISAKTGRILHEAGALVAFHTDDWITDSRLFLRSAGLAVREGMDREEALKALTINAASMMDLEKRIGSLERGKDADFILLDGDPLSVWTKVQETWVDGRKVFDRDDPEDRLWAVGGWGAGDPRGHSHDTLHEWEVAR